MKSVFILFSLQFRSCNLVSGDVANRIIENYKCNLNIFPTSISIAGVCSSSGLL